MDGRGIRPDFDGFRHPICVVSILEQVEELGTSVSSGRATESLLRIHGMGRDDSACAPLPPSTSKGTDQINTDLPPASQKLTPFLGPSPPIPAWEHRHLRGWPAMTAEDGKFEENGRRLRGDTDSIF